MDDCAFASMVLKVVAIWAISSVPLTSAGVVTGTTSMDRSPSLAIPPRAASMSVRQFSARLVRRACTGFSPPEIRRVRTSAVPTASANAIAMKTPIRISAWRAAAALSCAAAACSPVAYLSRMVDRVSPTSLAAPFASARPACLSPAFQRLMTFWSSVFHFLNCAEICATAAWSSGAVARARKVVDLLLERRHVAGVHVGAVGVLDRVPERCALGLRHPHVVGHRGRLLSDHGPVVPVADCVAHREHAHPPDGDGDKQGGGDDGEARVQLRPD